MANSIDGKIYEINQINTLQQLDQWMRKIHPLVKFSLTIIYILFVVSVGKYDLAKLISFAVFPFMLFNMAELSFKDALSRLRIVLPLVMVVGIFNPLFDRSPVMTIGNIYISGGIISMLTLMLKGVFSVLSAYVLIATTKVEEICYALRKIGIPKIVVTVILLIYRYIFILIDEAEKITAAYTLRAPSQKGLNFRVWGPLVGQWLLRSMDKADIVYESMCLRGFTGEFNYVQKKKLNIKDTIFFAAWVIVFFLFRYSNVVESIGRLFT